MVHGDLHQYYIELNRTENEVLFSSKFYLEEPIAEDSSIDLIVNSEIRLTIIHFDGEDDISKYNYSAYTFLPPNEQIRHCILGIKNADGSMIGLYQIFNNINGML